MATTRTRAITATATKTTRSKEQALHFDRRLVLNQYLLGLFGVRSFEELAKVLDEPSYEEWDENNISRFHHVLVVCFPDLPRLSPPGPSKEDLLRYDENIVRHTLRISARRGARIRWKYFQYLALLFTEIYLDRYFREPETLLHQLNAHIDWFNRDKSVGDRVGRYELADLRKLAFWMATGSGKTLLMHANILQYHHYLQRAGRARQLNRIILLTPNEGLSLQHRNEFARSGIPAELFDKNGGRLFAGQQIEIIDIHKLTEEEGEKTVAVDAFEGNNLVWVDEGHRGAGGLEWKDKRDRLCAHGFSFEYSATFGQAMVAARKEALTQEYARCILFDYSYKFFYGDGYGKDYQILNLESGDEETRHFYLVASLLTFYQQQALFEERSAAFAPYGIERPLWVFVGGSVTKGTSAQEKSDIMDVLLFLTRFVHERAESIGLLDRLLSGSPGLLAGKRDVFADKFTPLIKAGANGAVLYAAILARLFNAPGGGRLRVEELKGAAGELALRLGDAPPFGVINVGDARGLAKLCEKEPDLLATEQEFGGSLFNELNAPDSRINLLIGSRKFTEGWNSWRVSSMGLMNIGKTEGAQIIQLFGRGVRLKGLGISLKRSAAVPAVRHPDDIRILETLNIFGVRADYMQQFKQYLAEEGLPPNEGLQEFVLPVITTIPSKELKAVRLRGGSDFKRDGVPPTLGAPPADFIARPISLDWYPKLAALESGRGAGAAATPEEGKLEARHLAFIDLDALYFELVRYKNERGWTNFSLTREQVVALLERDDWYTLAIPTAELAFAGAHPLRRARRWQEIALALLKKYCDRYYKARREEYEAPRREYYVVDGGDGNFFPAYQFQVEETKEALIVKLQEIKAAIEAGAFDGLEFGPLVVSAFSRHLYRPLIHLKNKDVQVKPVALNEGEQALVEDLRRFYERRPDFFAGRELYLLRNLSRGKGIGFFEAGNFYPDFILWLLAGDRQYITFIDPKGIRNLEGRDDLKIQFHRTIKEIERDLGDPRTILNSFIISNTPYAQVHFWTRDKAEFTARHVLFQHDDKVTYIETMLRAIVGEIPSSPPVIS